MKRLLLAAGSVILLIAAVHPAPYGAAPAAPSLDREEAPLQRALAYLAAAQQADGGFGAGSNSAQQVLNAHAVETDPATTAFAALAFLRAGSSLTEGPYQAPLRRALAYLLETVEAAPEEAATITTLRGTQPQSKLGQDVDVAFTAQLLGRVLPLAAAAGERALQRRIEHALDVCARKLAGTQGEDGSWDSRGGWAGTLQSAAALGGLEAARAAGLDGYDDAVRRGRASQQTLLDATTGTVRTETAAGVSLYAISSAQRAAAPAAGEARDAVAQAKKEGRLDEDAPVSADALEEIGYTPVEAKALANAYRTGTAAAEMVQSDAVLQGFGSNGGEEFLSYMMTSESLLLSDREAYGPWQARMTSRLAAIQNADGSWSGHHCITSPVFCTAAVILTLTADRAA